MEPTQLGMPGDPQAGLRPMQPMPAYTPQRHDPYAPFAPFHPTPQPQSQPLPHQQGPAHHPPAPPPPPPHHHHPVPQPALQSPGVSRKRRASETENITGLPQLSSPPSAVFASESRYGVPTPGETESSSSAARKKSRTNTPWTPAEEQRLKTMRDAGQSWSEIAKTFPTRTEGSVKKHYYKDMHYAEFAEDEVSVPVRTAAQECVPALTSRTQSAALLAAIKEYEQSKWKVIGAKVGKPAKVSLAPAPLIDYSRDLAQCDSLSWAVLSCNNGEHYALDAPTKVQHALSKDCHSRVGKAKPAHRNLSCSPGVLPTAF
ncbi:MAG: hypothetical protein Q9162_003803 [Coniocarpon cinnabarinum]